MTGKKQYRAAEVPEKAKQAAEARPEKWAYVEASAWTDRMLEALDNGVKGGKWFSLIDKVHRPSVLEAAWRQVAANKGAAGVDGQSIAKFGARAQVYLAELERALKEGSYEPLPVKRVDIPKAGQPGKTRPLGIPCVKDRTVQMAMKMVMEPIFENEFLDASYGFRPGRGCKDALREVDRHLKDGYVWVVDADIKGYFDNIPTDRLKSRVGEKISDGRLLSLLDKFLKQDIMRGLERWTPTAGTPQGSVISPLLANIYLHPLDVTMHERGYRMVRYADDFVILCRTEAETQAALAIVKAWMEENGLTLHPDKTRLGNCLEKGQGFEFLGYRFERGKRFVRKKSMKALLDKVRLRTKRNNGHSLEKIIESLNPTLKGWFGYFKHARRSLAGVDQFVRRRLRAILRKRTKGYGFGKNLDDHIRWPNSYFANLGLFTLITAHGLAIRPR
jgi:RNA-directed DNA polymerase